MSFHLIRPILLAETRITSLISKLYGLHVKFVKELDSYDDRNYLLEEIPSWRTTKSRFVPEYEVNYIRPPRSGSRNMYVLKVLNRVDSMEPHKIDIQNEVILFAKQAGFPLPAPLPNLEGNYQKLMSFENKARGITETSLVRLFEFFPGTTLEKVRLTKPLCREIGHHAGWLDKICQNFTKYDESTYKILKRDWNLSQVSCLWSILDVIEDSRRRSLVSDVLSTFEENVLRNEDKFSKGYIHSDMNDCNIIVSQAPNKKDREDRQNDINGHVATESNDVPNDVTYHINAVIDFGDLCFSCHLYEIAIAICYVLINKYGVPPLEAAGCLYSGFAKHIQLSDFELQHLRTCVCTRLAQSIVMGLNTLKANPDNIYNLFHSSRMWEPLESIWSMSNEEFLQELEKEDD